MRKHQINQKLSFFKATEISGHKSKLTEFQMTGLLWVTTGCYCFQYGVVAFTLPKAQVNRKKAAVGKGSSQEQREASQTFNS